MSQIQNMKIEKEYGWNVELLYQLIESVKDYSIIITDLDGVVRTWNPGVEKLLGYSEAEFIGQNASIIFTPEDREAKVPEWEINTALKEGRCEDVRWHVRCDGSRFWANGLMMLLTDETEEIRGYVKIMRDNTRDKEAQEERERLLGEAEAATRAKDEFLTIVTHVLLTPLERV